MARRNREIYMTTAAVAKQLGVSRQAIIKADNEGRLPADNMTTYGHRLFLPSSVLRFSIERARKMKRTLRLE